MTKSQFNTIIDEYIRQESEYIKEHEAIKEILTPLEGKPIDGRTLNPKRLGDFKFKTQYGMHHICGKFEHLIGYVDSENLIAINETEYSRGFKYFDACNGDAAKKRIEQVKSTDKEKALKIFNKVEHHFNGLRKAFGDIERETLGSFDFPVYYELLRAIYNGTEIKLTNFYFIRK